VKSVQFIPGGAREGARRDKARSSAGDGEARSSSGQRGGTVAAWRSSAPPSSREIGAANV
jgi:hypothetical protein